jgi:hypothetical protein
MSDTPQAESNPQNTQADKKNSTRRYLWRIVIYAGVAYLILLGLSLFWPNLAERTKFFTANALTLALLIVAIAQAVIYYSQQQIMQGQLVEIERQRKILFDSLTETQKLVKHNERLTDASEAQRDAMQGQLGAMNAQAEAMREQVEFARKQVEAINISERAYLGIENIGLTDLEVGKVPRIVMIMKNAGRTPAKKVKAPGRINIELAGKRPQVEITKSRHIGDGMLAANAVRPCVYEFTGICDENMLYQITSQNWIVFFQGTVWYEDAWGNEWHESFFLEWDNREQAFLDRREKKAGEQERQNPNQNPSFD